MRREKAEGFPAVHPTKTGDYTDHMQQEKNINSSLGMSVFENTYRTCAMESLEERRLLAAQMLVDYYPLAPRSSWVYDVAESGGDQSTLNVNIAKKRRGI